jgi:ribosome modulation factor
MSKSEESFQKGVEDFNSGVDVDNSPFEKDSFQRLNWLRGWYEARTEKNIGHVLKKYENIRTEKQKIDSK